MKICIIGEPRDITSIYITKVANNSGIEVIELCEAQLGINWNFRFDDQNIKEGTIEFENRVFKFPELNGAFVRFNSNPSLPKGLDLVPKDKEFFLAERRAAIVYLLNNLPIEVANRPCSCWTNSSKPFQMSLLEKAGFNVPNWILTNQEKVVNKFILECSGNAVYKSCSGLRSRVRKFNIDILQKLKEGTSPFIIQKYIEGRDVRVHIVKDEVFATEVISKSVDYRFDAQNVDLKPTSTPIWIKDLCCKVVEKEGLIIGGFDFRVDEKGKWFCLELNPMPTFIYYEFITNQPIAKALLKAITKS